MKFKAASLQTTTHVSCKLLGYMGCNISISYSTIKLEKYAKMI